MPELPEVEVVRRGLDRWVSGRTVRDARVLHVRAARRHAGGRRRPRDATGGAHASSRRAGAASTSGSPLDGDDLALVGHLGMSGQLLVQSPRRRPTRSTCAPACASSTAAASCGSSTSAPSAGWRSSRSCPTTPTAGCPPPWRTSPATRSTPASTSTRLGAAAAASTTGIKRALLDQTLASGIGNIYADEALWRARLHWATPTEEIAPARARALLGHARDVMVEALAVRAERPSTTSTSTSTANRATSTGRCRPTARRTGPARAAGARSCARRS